MALKRVKYEQLFEMRHNGSKSFGHGKWGNENKGDEGRQSFEMDSKWYFFKKLYDIFDYKIGFLLNFRRSKRNKIKLKNLLRSPGFSVDFVGVVNVRSCVMMFTFGGLPFTPAPMGLIRAGLLAAAVMIGLTATFGGLCAAGLLTVP